MPQYHLPGHDEGTTRAQAIRSGHSQDMIRQEIKWDKEASSIFAATYVPALRKLRGCKQCYLLVTTTGLQGFSGRTLGLFTSVHSKAYRKRARTVQYLRERSSPWITHATKLDLYLVERSKARIQSPRAHCANQKASQVALLTLVYGTEKEANQPHDL